MATIREIAELAGVSRGTVDRVLNHRGSVNPATAALINEIARKLDYKPNRAGMALAAQRKNLKLGVLLFDAGNRYFEDVIGETAMALAEQGVTLTLRGDKSTAAVAIDRNQFRRVVENLLTNCVKYKTTPQADVDIVIAEEGESVVVSFVDHGVGVPAESLPKLFDSFYRTDAARTDVKKGSGLGLAIAKQIIESLHGSIWAEETKGGGLTISMRLPIAKEE